MYSLSARAGPVPVPWHKAGLGEFPALSGQVGIRSRTTEPGRHSAPAPGTGLPELASDPEANPQKPGKPLGFIF